MIASDTLFSQTIFKAICACLEISPNASSSSVLIRPAYHDPENAPTMPRDQNVIYYDVVPEDGEDANYQTVSDEDSQNYLAYPNVSLFLPFKLTIVCYGPDSSANAYKIRSFMFLDGSGYPRQILRVNGIYPVPKPPMPVSLREKDGAIWRYRSDVTISLRVKENLIGTKRRIIINQVPAVTIRRS